MPEVPSIVSARPTVLSRVRALPTGLRRHMSDGVYRPEIDGLRFFAIAIVLVGHLAERLTRFFPAVRALTEGSVLGNLIQRPGLGVYLFFAISGFILASGSLRTNKHPLSPSALRTYFGRRLLRIEPPYLLLLLATFAVLSVTGYRPDGTHQFEAEPRSLPLSLAGSIAYNHDLIWGTYPRLFPPGWSLEVEVQFYILAPLLFALWVACRGVVPRVLLGVAGLLGGCLLSLLAPRVAGPAHLDMSVLRFAHFFWLGVVLAQAQPWLVARMSHVPRVAADLLGWGGLLAFLLLPNAPDTQSTESFVTGFGLRLAALASVAAMFAAVVSPRAGFRTFCARPWISLLGGACYSLYLTHLQTMQVVTALAARAMPNPGLAGMAVVAMLELAIVLGVGLLFYALVERTFMRPDWPRALARALSLPRLARLAR